MRVTGMQGKTIVSIATGKHCAESRPVSYQMILNNFYSISCRNFDVYLINIIYFSFIIIVNKNQRVAIQTLDTHGRTRIIDNPIVSAFHILDYIVRINKNCRYFW